MREYVRKRIRDIPTARVGILEKIEGDTARCIVNEQVYPVRFVAGLGLTERVGEEVVITFIDKDLSDGIVTGIVSDIDTTVKDGVDGKDGEQGIQGEDGEKGETGVGIESIKEYYALSNVSTEINAVRYSNFLTGLTGWTGQAGGGTTVGEGVRITNGASIYQGLTIGFLPKQVMTIVVKAKGSGEITLRWGGTSHSGIPVKPQFDIYKLTLAVAGNNNIIIGANPSSEIIVEWAKLVVGNTATDTWQDYDASAEISTWSTEPMTPTTEYPYLWNYEEVKYTDGTSEETEKRVISVAGIRGIKGDKGDAGSTEIEGIDGLDDILSSLDGRVGITEGLINTNAGDISGLDGRVTVNEGLIGVNTSAISGLDGRVGANESDISGLNTRMGTAEGNITSLGNTKADKAALTSGLAGKVDKNTDITAGTYAKVTVDKKGLVLSGSGLSATDIPNLDVGKITTGAFATARIPSLDASKITTGTLGVDRIPQLAMAKIDGLDTALNVKADTSDLNTHVNSKTNPHRVTKAQIGLSKVNNTSDSAKPISTAVQTALNAKASTTALNTHVNTKNNPHKVTKVQVGLGNVDNTSDKNKPISTATQTALDAKADTSDVVTYGQAVIKDTNLAINYVGNFRTSNNTWIYNNTGYGEIITFRSQTHTFYAKLRAPNGTTHEIVRISSGGGGTNRATVTFTVPTGWSYYIWETSECQRFIFRVTGR